MNVLGSNIKSARKKIGLTQEELASQIGVTSQAVSRWESGAGMPDISLLVPLSHVLAVSIDMLFGVEQTKQDEAQYIELVRCYERIESEAASPAEAAIQECKMLSEKCELSPANYVYACCLVERTAELSRYIGGDATAQAVWQEMRDKAVRYGTQVIRFCSENEWVERTHYALSWIYIHDRNFADARDHIMRLPSVSSNRLRESILAQLTSIESGTEAMKKVLNFNLQMFTRALNKEILYAVEDLSWNDLPETAIEFATWGIDVMHILCRKQELLPYCRGFFRDIYRYILHADLRLEDYTSAAKHWVELKQGMQVHYDYYQKVLESDCEMEKFSSRQIGRMRSYTQEFMTEKQEGILKLLRQWHGEEKVQILLAKFSEL